MRALLNPVGLAMLALGSVAGAFNRWEFAAIGFVGYVGSLVWSGLKSANRIRAENLSDSVSNENRARIRPISRLVSEINDIIRERKNEPVVRAMSEQAIVSSQKAAQHAVELLARREALQRVTSYAAVAPESAEAATVRQASDEIAEIDSMIEKLTGVLSELRSRLAYAASGSAVAVDENIRDAMVELDSINQTFDEAHVMMGDQR